MRCSINSKENSTIFSSMDEELPNNPNDVTLATAKAYVKRNLPSNATNTINADMFEPRERRHGRPVSVPKIQILPEEDVSHLVNGNSYIYKRWVEGGDVPHPVGVHNPNLVDCELLDAVDWSLYSDNETVLFYNEQREFLFAKLSPRACADVKGSKGSRSEHMRNVFRRACRLKGNISRGKERKGVGGIYKCFGWRKCYDGLPLSEYVYQPSAEEAEVEWIDVNLKEHIRRMELVCRRVLSRLVLFHWLMGLARYIKLPSFSQGKRAPKQTGIFTQVAMSSDGSWSNVHTDKDYGITMLSTLSAVLGDKSEVIYHFHFPSYLTSIPLRSGDIILYDSNVPHCSSNPRNKDDYLYSAYISSKTVEYAMLEMVQELVIEKCNV